MRETTQAVEPVIKTDVLGRMRTPAVRRETLLDEFEQSGLSGKKFAALTGIKYQTLATWLQKRRRQRGAQGALKAPARTAGQVRWLEAMVEQAQAGDGKNPMALVLHLPGGARVELADAKQAALAAALLRVLAPSC